MVRYFGWHTGKGKASKPIDHNTIDTFVNATPEWTARSGVYGRREVTGDRKKESLAHLRVTLQRVTTSHGQLQGARATSASPSPSPSPLLTGGYLTPQPRLSYLCLSFSLPLSRSGYALSRAAAATAASQSRRSTVHRHQMDNVAARRRAYRGCPDIRGRPDVISPPFEKTHLKCRIKCSEWPPFSRKLILEIGLCGAVKLIQWLSLHTVTNLCVIHTTSYCNRTRVPIATARTPKAGQRHVSAVSI